MAPPRNPPIDHNILPWDKERIVFLHVPKTGGTTLTALITDAVGEGAVCPERFNDLPLWPAGLLARYRVFAGHFDRETINVIPGAQKKVVTILREPRARIISTYRFWRSHRREFAIAHGFSNILAAKDLDFLPFLKKISKTSAHDVDNMYARGFGGFFPISGEPDTVRGRSLEELGGGEHLVEEAINFLDSCAAVGILEEFDRSIPLIFDALNLPRPKGEIKPLLRNDELANDPNMYEPVGDFDITTEAQREIEKLTFYDRIIYQHAVSLFNSKN